MTGIWARRLTFVGGDDMTREEASKHLFDDWYIENGRLCVDESNRDAPVSREQVEQAWRGEWKLFVERNQYDLITLNRCIQCSKCGFGYPHKSNFCPNCGAAMYDKAVQMVMERLEELKDIK